MKIFQAYYKEDQKSLLDTEFTPFDNTANPVVNLHEYYIYTKIYEEAQKTNEDLWGHFSWKWRSRIPGVTAQQIVDIINLDLSYHVYTFNPYPQEIIKYWNVWEHGQHCHPMILELAEKIFKDMGLDPLLLQKPQAMDHYIVANYFVGNKKFWDGLLLFLQKFIETMDKFEGEWLEKLNTSADYRTNMSLNYKGFLCERMIGIYMMLNDQLRIRPFFELYYREGQFDPYFEEVLSLKQLGTTSNDQNLLREYLDKRPALTDPNGEDKVCYNWGNDWINTCVL
jgi:hypothetical protein